MNFSAVTKSATTALLLSLVRAGGADAMFTSAKGPIPPSLSGSVEREHMDSISPNQSITPQVTAANTQDASYAESHDQSDWPSNKTGNHSTGLADGEPRDVNDSSELGNDVGAVDQAINNHSSQIEIDPVNRPDVNQAENESESINDIDNDISEILEELIDQSNSGDSNGQVTGRSTLPPSASVSSPPSPAPSVDLSSIKPSPAPTPDPRRFPFNLRGSGLSNQEEWIATASVLAGVIALAASAVAVTYYVLSRNGQGDNAEPPMAIGQLMPMEPLGPRAESGGSAQPAPSNRFGELGSERVGIDAPGQLPNGGLSHHSTPQIIRDVLYRRWETRPVQPVVLEMSQVVGDGSPV